jgi:hypothetical protein
MAVLLWVVMTCAFTEVAHVQTVGENQRVFYLLEESGRRSLYATTLNGTTTSLSMPELGSVILYDVTNSGLAYVAQSADGTLALALQDEDETRSLLLPGSIPSQIVLTDDAVYVTVRNPQNRATVLGFDRATLAQQTIRSANLETTTLTIHDSGRWVLAYNSSGAMDVYALPGAGDANFELVDFGFTEPRWSPTREQLQFVGGSVQNPAERFIYLIDFANGTNSRFPILDVGASISASWSDGGQYVITSAAADRSALLLTNIDTGAPITLSEPGFILTPIGWSNDDQWLLYTAQLPGLGADVFAYNPVTGERFAVRSSNAVPYSARWSSTLQRIALLGVNPDNTIGLYTVNAPAFDVWQMILNDDDGRLIQAGLYWVNETLVLEYNGALLVANPNELVQITPETAPIVPSSVRVM